MNFFHKGFSIAIICIEKHPYPELRMIDLLQTNLKQLAIDVTEQQQQQLLQYLDLLERWNNTYNLTAIRDKETMLSRHILESLSLIPHLKGSQFIDVGTGAGLPGIPLAIAMPEAQFTLLDSLNKRMRFLTQVLHELHLANVTLACSRIEDFQPTAQYDGILSRAFRNLPELLHLTKALMQPQTIQYALKGESYSEEIAALSPAYSVVSVDSLQVPGQAQPTHLVQIKGAE